MAHIFLPDGRKFRVRLFPRQKAVRRRRKAPPTSLSLFDPPEDESLDTPAERLAARVAELCVLNANNALILDRFPELGLRDWWLASGCLCQTVWNLKSGNAADRGIQDYDICYFSEDTSAEAEDEVINSVTSLFKDTPIKVQVRNQARVHLWYPEKFGVAYPPLTTASEGIMRFTSSSQAIGIKRTGDEFMDVYAPFGVGDVWDMVVKPNRVLPMAQVYEEKAARWRSLWPRLTVYPWVDDDEKKST